jgi:hypothetical protein
MHPVVYRDFLNYDRQHNSFDVQFIYNYVKYQSIVH